MVKYNKTIKMLTLFTGMQIIDNSTIKFKDRPSKPFITLYSYYCKGIKKYRNKLRIYLYQEFNKPPYITNDWIFKSHYCIEKLGSPPDGFDEPYNGWSHLISDDGRLKYFIASSWLCRLDKNNYTEKDLEALRNKKYNRTAFKLSSKYKLTKNINIHTLLNIMHLYIYHM